MSRNLQARIWTVQHALEAALLACPTGPVRNALCDANILIGHAQILQAAIERARLQDPITNPKEMR